MAVSVTIDDLTHLKQILKELEVLGSVEVDENQSIICIVGNMVSETRGAVKSVMDSLVDFPIRMVSYGGSRHNVSLLIDSKFKKDALQNLNEGVFTW